LSIFDCEGKARADSTSGPTPVPGRRLPGGCGADWFDLTQRNDNFERPMITVTENAVRQLRALLESQDGSDGKGLRVAIAKGGCSGLQYEMSLDSQKSGDAIVARDGVEFFVDGESADYLRGSILDYRDGLTGAGFHIENPNAARTCGCGTSFEAARPA
jgi:iron-sulfur cluster assembly protein